MVDAGDVGGSKPSRPGVGKDLAFGAVPFHDSPIWWVRENKAGEPEMVRRRKIRLFGLCGTYCTPAGVGTSATSNSGRLRPATAEVKMGASTHGAATLVGLPSARAQGVHAIVRAAVAQHHGARLTVRR